MDMGMGFGRPGFGPGFGGGGLMFDFFELQIIRNRWAGGNVARAVCSPKQTLPSGRCDSSLHSSSPPRLSLMLPDS